jgi:hypothetical protein
MKRNISEDAILENIKYGCNCKKNCLDSFSIGEIKVVNSIYLKKSNTEKTQWLIDILFLLYDVDSDQLSLKIRGKDVCYGSFCSYYGLTEYKYYVCLNRVKNNNMVVIHGNSEREYRKFQSELCSTFLERYCSVYGEQQPDSDDVHLPHTCLKVDLYEQFKLECTESVVPHLNTFLFVWRSKFQKIIILDKCVLLSQEKLTLTHAMKANNQAKKS